jgi:pyruvate kinase
VYADAAATGALIDLEAEVRAVRDAMIAAEAARADEIARTHPAHRRSAANLVHYLELRRHDVRDLQARLAAVGLSSLGRSEAHVLATVEAVLSVLMRLNGHEPPASRAGVSLTEGHELLAANADALLGAPDACRSSRIMVTMPSEAAQRAELVEAMTHSGMDVARINAAHDDPADWERMVDHVRRVRRPNGEQPRVAMDLAGPKLRTGALEPGPRVARVSPRRDDLGAVVQPAPIWLTAGTSRPDLPARVTVVPVADGDWLGRRRRGERIELVDSRGSRRQIEVVDGGPMGCMAMTSQTAYLATGITLTVSGDDGDDATTIGELPEVHQYHRVQRGDRLVLTRDLEPARPSPDGDEHRIGCTLPEVFEHAQVGQRVFLDDGKIGGVIARVTPDEIHLDITDARAGGVKLKSAKGINLPDTDLRVDALTAKDLADLDVAARHADMVNLSFVRTAADVELLQRELDRRDAADVGVVLKIENAAAFEHLPELLLTAMRSRRVGVMIARGDLAVEVGFERLAEVQEEILWACEAAHVPVIWATQVLDTLARTGQPSRAEITDAAMSERAECVMLNKGPHIIEAIETLDSILRRMQEHQHKKRSLLRRLQSWDRPVHDAPGTS